MAIKVHGETYHDENEVRETIVMLEGQLEALSEDTPEHKDLAQHIARLKDALPTGGDNASDSTSDEPEDTPSDVTGEDETEVESGFTHDIQEAFETGAEILCPTCGQHVDFPEAPPINPDAEQCPKCKGWGKYVNPSRVDGYIWQTCSHCQGQGFTVKGEAPPLASVAAPADMPLWAGATWDAETQGWNPPPGEPPWTNAEWDRVRGTWA